MCSFVTNLVAILSRMILKFSVSTSVRYARFRKATMLHALDQIEHRDDDMIPLTKLGPEVVEYSRLSSVVPLFILIFFILFIFPYEQGLVLGT